MFVKNLVSFEQFFKRLTDEAMGSLVGAEVYYQKFIELQEKLRKRYALFVFHTCGYVYVCIVPQQLLIVKYVAERGNYSGIKAAVNYIRLDNIIKIFFVAYFHYN